MKHIKRQLEFFLFKLLFISIGVVGLVSCSSDGEKRPEYMGAVSLSELEVPPKLSRPNTQGALRLPEPSKTTPSDSAKIGKDEVIAPIFEGIALKHEGRLYWLEIDEPVSEVWDKIPKFLASEGIDVDRVEKLLGFVDTIWMDEYKVTYNKEESSSSWFGSFSPDYKDRFRIRIEPVTGENKTRLYVTHRGLQISVSSDVSAWVQRDSEAFLEREIMYRYVLFSGIGKSNATQLLASYHSYQPRIDTVADDANVFDVKGETATVWQRLRIALDRLGVDVIESNAETQTLMVKIGSFKGLEAHHQEESGGFSGLFGGKDIQVDDNDDEYDDATYKAPPEKVAEKDHVIFKVILNPGEYSSAVRITNEDGSDITGSSALTFRDALLKQLK